MARIKVVISTTSHNMAVRTSKFRCPCRSTLVRHFCVVTGTFVKTSCLLVDKSLNVGQRVDQEQTHAEIRIRSTAMVFLQRDQDTRHQCCQSYSLAPVLLHLEEGGEQGGATLEMDFVSSTYTTLFPSTH